MTDEERALHKQQLLDDLGLARLQLPHSPEDTAIYLLGLGLGTIARLHSEQLLSGAEAQVLRVELRAVFEAAHPQLSGLFVGAWQRRSDEIAELLAGQPPDNETLQAARAAVQEFRKRGLKAAPDTPPRSGE